MITRQFGYKITYMNSAQLYAWFQTTYPHLYQEWVRCNHSSGKSINPHHAESELSSHMAQVMLAAEILKISYLGKVAALCHDLGKPITRFHNEKDDKVKFFGHESVSAFMSLEIMNKLNIPIADQVQAFQAIAFHQDFYRKLSDCNSSFSPLTIRYSNMTEMFKLLVELCSADALGRFSLSDSRSIIDPQELNEVLEINGVMEDIKFEINKQSDCVVETLIGLPGSGKSTYRNKNKLAHVICRDDILREMFPGKTYVQSFQKANAGQVNQALDEKIRRAFQHYQPHVILDLTNMKEDMRNAQLKQVPHYKKIARVFLCELPELRKRNTKRAEEEGKFIPEEVYFKMMRSFVAPTHETFDEIYYHYQNQIIKVK